MFNIQILTGIFSNVLHTLGRPSIDSLDHIMRDVNNSLLLRYSHANGSLCIVVLYTHMLRGLYFGSYRKPCHSVWVNGVVILLLMILTEFKGYELLWGQMSLRGATVINNLVSSDSIAGNSLIVRITQL